MHLLYVIDSLSPAGAERSLADLAPYYVRAGVVLDVAYLHDRAGLQQDLTRAGAALFSLARSGNRLGWVRDARRLMRRRRPDLVHTTLFEADVAGRLAARLGGVPVVSSLVNLAYGPEHRHAPGLAPWKVRAAQFVDAATARAATRFHAVTAQVAEVMGKRLRIRRDRIDVVPRGRDPRHLGTRAPERRAAARRSLGLTSEDPIILAVARQEHQKGLDVLLEAFPSVLSDVPGARLIIAGREGNQTPRLRAAVDHLERSDAVRFLGARGDVPELLCAADVFVLPSRWEGFPGALLEAMALEAPIVASDIPPAREAVGGDEFARLVQLERPDLLAQAIVATTRDPAGSQHRAELGRRRFLDHFTVDRIAHRMLAFYERALSTV